jgi:hypothetical protein
VTDLDTLTEFLRARLDDDERIATHDGVLAGDEWHVMEPLPGRVTAEVLRIGGTVAKAEHHDAQHMARWDPKRALAEVDAKRRMLALHEPRVTSVSDFEYHEPNVTVCTACSLKMDPVGQDEHERHPCPTLRLLALPFADHPDYDESWRP